MNSITAFLDENVDLEQYNELITNEYEQTNAKFNDVFKDINLRQKIMKANIPPRDPRKFHLGEYCVIEDMSHEVIHDMGCHMRRTLDEQYDHYLRYTGSKMYWERNHNHIFSPNHISCVVKGVAILNIDREKGKIKCCKMIYYGDHWEHQRATSKSLNVREWCDQREEYAGKVAHKHIWADKLYPIGMTKDEFIAYRKTFKK